MRSLLKECSSCVHSTGCSLLPFALPLPLRTQLVLLLSFKLHCSHCSIFVLMKLDCSYPHKNQVKPKKAQADYNQFCRREAHLCLSVAKKVDLGIRKSSSQGHLHHPFQKLLTQISVSFRHTRAVQGAKTPVFPVTEHRKLYF